MRKIFIVTLFIAMSISEGYIYSSAGKELKINIFINYVEVHTPVYENTSAPPIQGDDYYSVYVDLITVFEELKAKVKVKEPNTVFITSERTGNLKIVIGESIYRYKRSSFIGEKICYNILDNQTLFYNGRAYITLSAIRYLIDGSLKQENKAVYLFSSDFERLDIPGTLDECFKCLDSLLSEDDKRILKETPENELKKYHHSLGAWIRNEWIRPSKTRIAKYFLDKEIRHPDTMSSLIIKYYHRYLNEKKTEEKN